MRLRANWKKLEKVPLNQRLRVLELADQQTIPDGEPRIVSDAVRALKRNRTILEKRSRVRPLARAYSKRTRLLKRIASEASQRYGVDVTSQQLRHWNDKYDELKSLISG
jgi:hypothetical protein